MKLSLKFLLVTLTFLFIYNPAIKVIPLISPTKGIVLLSYFLIVMYLLKGKVPYFSKDALKPLPIVVLLFLYSLLVVTVKQTYQFSQSYNYFLIIADYMFGSFVILYLLQKLDSMRISDLLDLLINIFFLQSLIIILMLVIPAFRDFIYSILRTDVDINTLNLRYGGMRGFGFSYSFTYDLAVIQSLGLMFIGFRIPNIKGNLNIVSYVFKFICILISIFISGRTGLFGLGLTLIFLLYDAFSKMKSIKYHAKFVFLFILISLCVYSMVTLVGSDDMLFTVARISDFAFEMFVNYQTTGRLETDSTNHLKTMYFDISYDTLLFGDGYYTNPNGHGYYMGTDAGYMRQLLFFGLPGSILLYFFYFYLFLCLIKKMKKSYDMRHIVLIMMIFGYFFIVHAKGDFLSTRMPTVILFLILNVATNEIKGKGNSSVTKAMPKPWGGYTSEA